jgi:hypothetical protein
VTISAEHSDVRLFHIKLQFAACIVITRLEMDGVGETAQEHSVVSDINEHAETPTNESEMDVFKKTVQEHFEKATRTVSDINEHVATLSRYAEECKSIVEFGVRAGVSSWGFVHGLLKRASSGGDCSIHGYDLNPMPLPYDVFGYAPRPGFISAFTQANVLHIPPVGCDLLFIDTFHVYGQLRRELSRHAQHVKKYIILHDTTVDEWEGELKRNGWNASTMGAETGIPPGELLVGLWPAVMLFLEGHAEWKIKERFENNNGLTVLERQQA